MSKKPKSHIMYTFYILLTK